ncbi:TRAP transporter small permease [Oceaniglobus ichthyenteri]|uniref:TRAP transporter small permease n=1 Tax=Oceaniglobus ichthyenteri TaxID=2136177 RepID=UPI000D332938|nr:TRAP transporter small permease [Oceaniglobus ichthyenteri]
MLVSRWARTVNFAGIFVAQISLLLLMLIITYAVIARYVLQSPSVHAVEISSYILAVMIWSALGWTHIENRHVALEHFRNGKSGVMARISAIISELSIMIFSLTLIYAGIHSVFTAYDKGYRSASLLDFPKWPLLLLIPLGATALGMVSAGRLLAGLRKKDER